MLKKYLIPCLLSSLALCGNFHVEAGAAENLRLRDGISFDTDLDKGFPIIADKMDDVQIAANQPTLLFFGACGDLNTNRQARRIVDTYKKYQKAQVKFIVIDVDKPVNAEAKKLIKAHYQGYIPAQVIFDKTGKAKWNHAGEVDAHTIANQLEKTLQ